MLFFCKERNFINDELFRELYEEAETLIKKINAFKKTINWPRAISHVPQATERG